MKIIRIVTLLVVNLLAFYVCHDVYAADDKNQNVDQKYSEMTFEKTNHSFGVFDTENAKVSCYFVFKNTGTAPLNIKSAVASCGCTIPVTPKKPIAPGAKDSILVTYDGTTRRPGVFRKVITVVTDAKVNTAYLYITGEMVDRTASVATKE